MNAFILALGAAFVVMCATSGGIGSGEQVGHATHHCPVVMGVDTSNGTSCNLPTGDRP
jgi:hypothetical protein